MFEKKPDYALVLSGGGAKGAYEVGAWKALKDLDVRINAVCGTSVGALNAAIIAQDDYELGVKIWSEMTINKVVNIPEGLMQNGKLKFNFKNMMKISELNLNFNNIGLDPAPLHNLLKTEINEDKIRRSGIDLGIVTIKVDSFQPCEIFLEDMPLGSLPDYLLASASFPMFKRAEINGKKFADGGMYDNIPHAMMKNRGYRRIIVVDIGGLGVNKRPDISGTDTVYIKNLVPLGNTLDFNPDKARDAMNSGYLDTMKVYEKNDGLFYYITRDLKLEKHFYDLLMRQDNIDKYSQYLKLKGRKCTPDNAEALIREIMPREQRSSRNLVLCLAECAATALDVKQDKLYEFSELIDAIKDKYSSILQKGSLPTARDSESFFEMIEHTVELFVSDRKIKDYCPYEYGKIMRNEKAAENFFPVIAAADIFLSLL